MRTNSILFLIATVLLFSCKKEYGTTTYPTPPDPPDPPVPAVLLKDIVIPNLPSPYYHFEYDTAGKITLASFASGFNTYNVTYNINRVTGMDIPFGGNPGRLQYLYDIAGRVNFINYTDLAGILQIRFSFSYNGEKLVKIERERRTVSNLVLNKTITLSYYADGNLSEITYHYPFVSGFQDETTFTVRFEQYDNKTNVDDFELVHNDFFDHLTLLPGVKLQKNNPGREIHTGDGTNFTVDYIYIYNDNQLPQVKNGNLTFTNGTNAGQTFQTHSTYSYY